MIICGVNTDDSTYLLGICGRVVHRIYNNNLIVLSCNYVIVLYSSYVIVLLGNYVIVLSGNYVLSYSFQSDFIPKIYVFIVLLYKSRLNFRTPRME